MGNRVNEEFTKKPSPTGTNGQESIEENLGGPLEIPLERTEENGALTFRSTRIHPGLPEKKIAIVCDWLKDWGGAEQVLADILELFPHSDVFSSVYFPEKFGNLF